MNWMEEAKHDLKRYNQRKSSIKHLEEELAMVNDQMHSISSGSADSTPVHGGGNKFEDKMINSMMRKSKLEQNLKNVKHYIKKIDEGLAMLTDEQRAVLDVFYIRGYHGTAALTKLEDLHYEKTKVYELRNEALKELTICLYGYTDS